MFWLNCSTTRQKAPSLSLSSANMWFGSLLGKPSEVIIDPSGKSTPLFIATRAFPKATLLVAISRIIGFVLSVPGIAIQIGFVTKRPSAPPYGATIGSCPVTFTK